MRTLNQRTQRNQRFNGVTLPPLGVVYLKMENR